MWHVIDHTHAPPLVVTQTTDEDEAKAVGAKYADTHARPVRLAWSGERAGEVQSRHSFVLPGRSWLDELSALLAPIVKGLEPALVELLRELLTRHGLVQAVERPQ